MSAVTKATAPAKRPRSTTLRIIDSEPDPKRFKMIPPLEPVPKYVYNFNNTNCNVLNNNNLPLNGLCRYFAIHFFLIRF